MNHMSRSAARRYRRKLATGWVPPSPEDPLPPVDLLHRGKPKTIERTRGSMRRDLFLYSGEQIVGLTTLAKATGWSFP